MAKAFSIRDYMEDARQQVSESDAYEKVNVFDIKPNPKNEYELSEIEKLKDSIFALGGVQQNLVLMCMEGNAEYKYLALDGHRRHKACLELVQEGHKEFELVPAVIKKSMDADTEDALLVLMNNSQRNKTDWEKVMEHMKLKEIIPKLKKRQNIDGRTRDIEADYFGVSQTQIGIYNTIGTRLDAELMKVFKAGSIGVSLAYEAAKLEAGGQKQLMQVIVKNGSFTEEDVKRIAGSRAVKGQMSIADISKEDVSDSDTFENVENNSVPSVENVTESDACVGVLQQGAELEKTQAKFRGGYDLELIENQIKKYNGYLNMLASGKDRVPHVVGVYNCMLDALELLKINLLTQKESDACEDI
jgi:ParB-like chromosome segregation protein Spo0J